VRFLFFQILLNNCLRVVFCAVVSLLCFSKFHAATPPVSKVLAAITLHFKPIFDRPLKKL